LRTIKVAIPVHVNGLFDYLPGVEIPSIGSRVLVPFGRRSLVGIVIDNNSQSNLQRSKLKEIVACMDKSPILTGKDVDCVVWASSYYHEPIGLVAATFVPSLLRQADSAGKVEVKHYALNKDASCKGLSKKQQELYKLLANKKQAISYWDILSSGFRDKTVSALVAANIIEPVVNTACCDLSSKILPSKVDLNLEQRAAVENILESNNYSTFLLEGITGSGKTQVYLETIAAAIAAGGQALVLLPEIGLTPQTLRRFQDKFDLKIAVIHSRLTEIERLSAWMQAYTGEARLVIGTRSAVFTPMPDLKIIVVDEEHDLSFKQQSGFRYSARDIAVVRAKTLDIKIILGSATPALESYNNVAVGRYKSLQLTHRAGGANLPDISLIDMRGKKLKYGLSENLIKAIERHIKNECQVLLFLNRRGYSPVLFCHNCGWSAECKRCDSNYTYYKDKNSLSCHRCNSRRSAPSQCGKCNSDSLCDVGVGTEKLEAGLKEIFPEVQITRVDRDVVSASNPLEVVLDDAYQGKSQILVGTQMLAKGHHLPKLTLVAVIDADGALYSSDFRATEKLMQTVVQVAGRSGREDIKGEVMIQTHLPDNRFLQSALHEGYSKYVTLALAERAQASLPPYASLALLNAEAMDAGLPIDFLAMVREKASAYISPGIAVLGPMAAALPKKSGKYRAHLLLHGMSKVALQQFLRQLLGEIASMKYSSKVRWHLDVDPQEMQ
jgi:primosomal protein N' (replication factor Y) (superfamily II helicase)